MNFKLFIFLIYLIPLSLHAQRYVPWSSEIDSAAIPEIDSAAKIEYAEPAAVEFDVAESQYYPLFEEYFSTDNRKWSSSAENTSHRRFVKNGVLIVQNNQFFEGQRSFMPSTGVDYKKAFYISFSCNWLKGNRYSYHSVRFCDSKTMTDYIDFGINEEGMVKMVSSRNSSPKTIGPYKLADLMPPHLLKAGSHTIEVRVTDNTFYCYVDDYFVLSYSRPESNELKIETIAFSLGSNQTVEFDDLRLGYLKSLKDLIKDDVQIKIEAWQKKGEFEKTVDFKARVNSETRELKIFEYQKQIIDHYKKIYFENADYSTFTVGDYDADNECYLLSSPQLGEYIVGVPMKSAPVFKQRFNQIKFKNPEAYFDGERFRLSYFEMIGPESMSYQYKKSDASTYAQSIIKYDYDDIKLRLEEDASSLKRILKDSILLDESDVDIEIPVCRKKKPDSFALVIGNENYSKEVKVKYAKRDAIFFSRYLESALGIPKDNIRVIEDGTYGQILTGLDWVSDIISSHKGEASFYFYYAGHGVPDEKTRQAFMLPVDGSSQNTRTAVSLGDLYSKLSEYPTASVTVFIDACFSGAVRSSGNKMLAEARGVRIKPGEVGVPGNLIVFSASQGDETALPFDDQQHGMFTYFLLRKLKESKGDCTLGELFEYTKDNVMRNSLKQNDKVQTPNITTGQQVGQAWEKMKFK